MFPEVGFGVKEVIRNPIVLPGLRKVAIAKNGAQVSFIGRPGTEVSIFKK
jgi:hypothetical protein